MAIGPKDLESGTVELARRDTLTKQVVALEDLTDTIKTLITEIQTGLFQKALDFRAITSQKWKHLRRLKLF